MIVRYKGPDTSDKLELLSGSHDGELPKVKENKVDLTKVLESKYNVGFIASYFFFDKGTNQNGYDTDNKKADLVKELKSINFANDAAFK
jgi:hypothetical protein